MSSQSVNSLDSNEINHCDEYSDVSTNTTDNCDIYRKIIEFDGPYGPRRLYNCALGSISPCTSAIYKWMEQYFNPFYSNTHSEASRCAVQTSEIRESGRNLIRQCLNIPRDKYAVIFLDGPYWRACRKLAHCLQIIQCDEYCGQSAEKSILILITQFESSSSMNVWKQCGCIVRIVKCNRHGRIDKTHLLKQFRDARKEGYITIICSFPGINNVTGLFEKVDELSEIVSAQRGYAFWDYSLLPSCIANNLEVISENTYIEKDAMFIGMNNSIAGPDTCNVLIIKLNLMKTTIPEEPGGGTVQTVTDKTHEYANEIQYREEGGTPNIIGSVRCALAFRFENDQGKEILIHKNCELIKSVFEKLCNNNHLLVFGGNKLGVRRVSVFSFLVKLNKKQKFMHPCFICQLLNDLFGVQSNYGSTGFAALQEEFGNQICCKGIPSICSKKCYFKKQRCKCNNAIQTIHFTQIKLCTSMSDQSVSFILDSIEFVAKYGWKFLPEYSCGTYGWTNKNLYKHELISIGNLQCTKKGFTFKSNIDLKEICEDPIAEAHKILERITLKYKENVYNEKEKINETVQDTEIYVTVSDALELLKL